jgi:hypothetical protein
MAWRILEYKTTGDRCGTSQKKIGRILLIQNGPISYLVDNNDDN